MKFYSDTFVPDSQGFYLKARCTIKSSDPFSLALGNELSGSFATGFCFSGYSGYLFDPAGKFFGGFYNGKQFEIECHCFSDRLSYFHNGVLMSNNIPISNDFNCVEFDKQGSSYVDCDVVFFAVNETEGLKDFYGITLISSDNYVLTAS